MYIQAIDVHECEILIISSNNYFKETITLDCDVRPDVERRYLHVKSFTSIFIHSFKLQSIVRTSY